MERTRHQKRTARQQYLWNEMQRRNSIKNIEWLYNYYRYYSGLSAVIGFEEFLRSKHAITILEDRNRMRQRD